MRMIGLGGVRGLGGLGGLGGLVRRLRQDEIDLVLASGAHDGGFGRGLRRGGYRGRIVSFEPFGGPRCGVRRAAERDRAWRVLPYALGDRDTSWIRRLDGVWDEVVAPGERVLLQVDREPELSQVLAGAGRFGAELALVRTGVAGEAAVAR
ncbi:hypothetical protein [Streptomyces beihaiensis]|uniref:Uncharacterized protein n=1 Tax=Streptomyces beihaiensis TaxID=2984495 RepID=A0ABT3TY86_9ACTN|nr:hypothetical protein [Streptomyces beihaiensis]MCX3060943.1 hypothetical protein [Streptomyces beihaiensis]